MSFDDIYCSTTTDIALSTFITKFTVLIEKYAPIIKKRVKTKRQAEWINDDIIIAMKQRDYYHILDNEKYKYWRNQVKYLINESKKSYYSEIIKGDEKGSNQIWKYMHSLTGSISHEALTIKCPESGNIFSDSSDIAEAFNDYFANIFSKTDNTIESDAEEIIH